MAEPQIRYDEPSDTLHVSFAPGEAATGVELNDNLLLRIDKPTRRAVGLTVLNYSLLAQATEVGPRSVPLTGLADLGDEMRDMALAILRSPPVNEFLLLSAYSPAAREVIPIALLRLDRITSRAA